MATRRLTLYTHFSMSNVSRNLTGNYLPKELSVWSALK
jgi:hypothetical protein